MAYRVFLSSTSQDLADHREAVLAAIVRLDGFAPIAMENFGARPDAAADFDDRRVRQSDVLVGLLGLCCGSHPRAGPPSFTEREYDGALEAGIDRLMFVSPDDFPVPGHLIEPDAKRQSQQAFRAGVKADLIVDGAAAFASPDALARAVTGALANWRAGREKVDEITAELVAAKEAAAKHEARAAELERTLAEGQKDREALRAAVQALADKARQPDAPPGVEHALALLREGKTREAEAIFSDLIARKEAEGADALRQAAAAARHLGALAYLDSTPKAIEAYATATRLDPDDAWSWIFLGRLHQQAGDLPAAEQAFRRAREAAERAGDERDVMVADGELGDLHMAKGERPSALSAYEAILATARRAAARDPANAEWQRDLSVSLDKIGDVRVAAGDRAGALEAYEQSRAIRETLAARDPANALWQRDLSVSLNKIGDLRVAAGDRAGALEAYEQGRAIRETLAARDPANAEWQRDLSVSLEKIGDVRVAQGDRAGALEAYQQSRAIHDHLAARDPANAEWQRDCSVSLERIGNVRVAAGDRAGAIEAYEQGRAIRETLAARDPANAEWQRDLSVSLNKIGDVRVAQGDRAGALEAYEQSRAIAETLAARDPANAEWQRDLGISNERIGDVLVAQGKFGEALGCFERKHRIISTLAALDPANAEWQRDLIVSHWKLAEVAEAQDGQAGEAARRYRAALDLALALRDSGRLAPVDAWMVGELEACLARLGQAAAG